MGFSAPKPDPKITAEEDAQAAQARSGRISLIQGQLDNEDQLRARLYGTRGASLFGGQSAQQGVSPAMTSLFTGLGGLA